MRLINLLAIALFACALNSALGWLAVQHQALFAAVRNGYCVAILGWIGGWFLDDRLADYLKMETPDVWAALIGFGLSVAIGLGAVALW